MPTKTQVRRETVERLRIALGITSRYLRATDAGEGLTPTELSILATISRRGSLRLNRAFVDALAAPEMRARLATLLAEPSPTSPEQFAAFVKSELQKYERAVKASGAKVE